MSRAKKNKAATSSLWHQDETFVENPAAPSIKRSLVQRAWARRGLGVVAFVGVPMACLIMINGAVNPPEVPKPPSLAAASMQVNGSLGKTAAVEAVREWLAQDPSPLPGGRISSWDGYETVPTPVPVSEKQKVEKIDYKVELHHFTIVAGSGDDLTSFDCMIEVAADKLRGAKITSTPTLLPRAHGDETWLPRETWHGFPSREAPKPVVDAVDGWVTAFTSGKPEVLRLAVGDPDETHSYVPLTGITSATPSIIASADVPVADADAVPTRMLVRVTIGVVWAGQPLPDPTSPASRLPQLTYDLLVDGADTAAPRVVSWGGPGKAAALKPYGPAITGADVVASAPPVAPSEEPTGQPGQSQQEKEAPVE